MHRYHPDDIDVGQRVSVNRQVRHRKAFPRRQMQKQVITAIKTAATKTPIHIPQRVGCSYSGLSGLPTDDSKRELPI